MQDYPSVQMIVMDDGSTDNIMDVVDTYSSRFIAKGYSLEYHFQENSGQSSALNNSLKYVEGEFFAWPDSDDWYTKPYALSKMANSLIMGGVDIGCVCSAIRYVDEESLAEVYSAGENRVLTVGRKQWFEDCLFARNGFYFNPGAFMVKSKYLLNIIGKDGIFVEKNAGQNWQLMLPIFYNYDCAFIPEILHEALIRKNSHSRGQFLGYEQENLKNTIYRETILQTLQRIPNMLITERERLSAAINRKYNNLYMTNAYETRHRNDYIALYHNWDEQIMGKKTFKARLKFLSVLLRLEWLVELYYHGI